MNYCLLQQPVLIAQLAVVHNVAPSVQQIADNVGCYMNRLHRRKQILRLAHRGH
jgi:hypothetical protein